MPLTNEERIDLRSVVDHVQPDGAWAFDASVAEAFDDMLARSIPQYDVMRDATTEIAARYAQRSTRVVDYGCSRGAQLDRLIKVLGVSNTYLGLEISDPMIAAARELLRPYIDMRIAEVRRCDLRRDLPGGDASVATSVLTLQFVPIEYRQRIVRHVYNSLLPGGAFVLVEKCLGKTYELDQTFVELYYELKQRNGYTPSDIERKRFSLEGVLVPITAEWNEALLHNAGFADVDCFWRWMNFAGWVAIKQ